MKHIQNRKYIVVMRLFENFKIIENHYQKDIKEFQTFKNYDLQ